MVQDKTLSNLFIRHIALPQDHGSWVFLLSPLLIGLFASKTFTTNSLILILAAMAAFLIRQPVTMAIKSYSGRRSRKDLPAAWFWILVYGLIGLICLLGLMVQGFSYLLILALPGLPVFLWHLYLVSKRAERRQIGVEIVGSGVLALAAPAAYWVGLGSLEPAGWWLFLLTWLQSAASIVYAYLRLEQRILPVLPDVKNRLILGRRSILYTSFNFIFVSILSVLQILPIGLSIPFALQWGETIYGTLRPAIGVKPTRIGIRQLIVSSIFTILFIFAWSLT